MNKIDIDGIASNYKSLSCEEGLDGLTLYKGYASDLIGGSFPNNNDALDLMYGNSSLTPNIYHTLYDSIITDPPYDMNEKIQSEIISSSSNNCRKDNVFSTINDLISISSKYLVAKGRLVFFYPQWNLSNDEKGSTNCEFSSSFMLPNDLTILATIRQQLSPTFSRWLIVIGKLS